MKIGAKVQTAKTQSSKKADVAKKPQSKVQQEIKKNGGWGPRPHGDPHTAPNKPGPAR